MAKERAKRYREKFELVYERLEDVKQLLQGFDDKIKRLACYKAFQEIVEALCDIIAMTIKDKGKVVDDDYKNAEKLEQLKIITNDEMKVLQEANGLRNRVIHHYNKTDDRLAKESMESLIPALKNIAKKLERT